MKKTKEKHTLECACAQPTMRTHKSHKIMCAYARHPVRTHKKKISMCAYAQVPARDFINANRWGRFLGLQSPIFGPSEADSSYIRQGLTPCEGGST
ncbi:uncharacterized protein DS421_14g465250 [Arachis hypogaea]|nr:uncharacterized protein DS421_14g465250 [Arachis hypogaea]